jgi:hypothetical protein
VLVAGSFLFAGLLAAAGCSSFAPERASDPAEVAAEAMRTARTACEMCDVLRPGDKRCATACAAVRGACAE